MLPSTPNPSPKPAPTFRNVGENLYRHESSGKYYGLLKRAGKQFRRSLKTTDRDLAKRRLQELRDQVGGLSLTDDANLSFETVALRWLETTHHAIKPATVNRRKLCIKALAPFFRGVTIRNARASHCEQWVIKRGANIAAQSFCHELSVLRNVFDYARRQGLLLTNPARDIKRPRIVQAKITIPTREQFQKLVQAIRHSDGRADSQAKASDGANLVELLAYSGCRLGEATALRWRDVSFERNCITITGGETGTKNHEDRTVPMTSALRELLERIQAASQPQPQDLICPIASAKKCLQTACRRLGFPQFTHHDFRHLFATTCIESGVDIPTVAKWLGHKDGGALAMKVYGHLRQEHSFSMIKRVSFTADTAPNVLPMPAPPAAIA